VENEQGEIIEVQSPGTVSFTPPLLRNGPRIPETLVLCHACDNYNYEHETDCHFCGADIKAVNKDYDEKMEEAVKALERLEAVMMG
jgi:uncharacterized paraquat-inducible protein A